MKIECKIRRNDGSTVVLGDKTYRFLPDESGRHVADVDDEAHIDILLANGAFGAADEAPAGGDGDAVKKERKPRKQKAKPDEAPAGGDSEINPLE